MEILKDFEATIMRSAIGEECCSRSASENVHESIKKAMRKALTPRGTRALTVLGRYRNDFIARAAPYSQLYVARGWLSVVYMKEEAGEGGEDMAVRCKL